MEPDEWSNSRVTREAQVTVPAQNKWTRNTSVGIAALQGILVKEQIRKSAYQHESIRRNSWNRPGRLPIGLLCCWTKYKFKRRKTFPCTGVSGCSQTSAGLRGRALVRKADHNHLQLLWLLPETEQLPRKGRKGESGWMMSCRTQEFNCIEMHFQGQCSTVYVHPTTF